MASLMQFRTGWSRPNPEVVATTPSDDLSIFRSSGSLRTSRVFGPLFPFLSRSHRTSRQVSRTELIRKLQVPKKKKKTPLL